MKVAQINSVCGIGSTGRIAKDLSETMNENRIENFIFYGVNSSDYPYGVKFGNKLNIRVHQLDTRLRGWHGYSSHSATKKLLQKLDQFDPDIIHLHNIHGFYVNIELLFHYLAETNKPVVWTIHDCWSFTGHCAHFDFIGCEKWKTGCNNCPQKDSYPVSWFFDRSKKQWESKRNLFTSLVNLSIITPSEWMAKLAKQSFLSNHEIKVINNGIDLDVFKPTKSNFKEERNLLNKKIVLGVASQWTTRKGLSYFNELSKMLDNNFQIVLIGLSEEQKNSLPKNIIGINCTSSTSELAGYYSMADVFVNPTLEDNFPTVNLEALACGTPVITFNTGGSPECISSSCGITVEKGNISGLVSSIGDIFNTKISEQSCLDRAKYYNKREKFNEYINVYRGMINS